MKSLAAGTELELEDGLITKIRDASGCLWLQAQGHEGKLSEAHFRLPDGTQGILKTGYGVDSVLGDVDAFFLPDALEPCAFVQAIDWHAPSYIPAVDKPARLPSGLGAAVLNYLSLHAQLKNIGPLQYRGPYATGKLFDSLHRSFHLGEQDPMQAWSRFNQGVESAALQAQFVSPEVDFFPAPFEWVAHTPSVIAEVRTTLARLMIDGRAYERDENTSRQLIETPQGLEAAIVLGGEVWAQRLSVDAQGCPLTRLAPVPDVDSPLVGRSLDEPLRKVLADALVRRAPAVLQEVMALVLLRAPLVWGDAGDEACRLLSGSLVLHAGMAGGLAKRDPEEVLKALAYALEPVATKLARQVLETQESRGRLTNEERA